MDDYIVMQAKREIGIQILLAKRASKNIEIKSERDHLAALSSMHSFLTHCANISKLLWSPPARRGHSNIKSILGVNLAKRIGIKDADFPLLQLRDSRDHFDHFDERLVEWIEKCYPKDPAAPKVSVLDWSVGARVKGPNQFVVRHYDPDKKILTIMDEELCLGDLDTELTKLQAYVDGPRVLGE